MAEVEIQPDVYNHYTAYFTAVRDARERARAVEREILNAGESLSQTVHNWEPVRKGAESIFALGVADVSVIAWNIEALARLQGFEGLAKGFEQALSLLQAHFPRVFSPDMSNEAALLAPFAGLNGISSEGSLIQSIRLVPLLPGYAYGTMNLWMMQRAERSPSSTVAAQINEAKADVRGDELRALLRSVLRSASGYAQLSQWMDSVCGVDAPGSSFTTHILEEALEAAQRLSLDLLGEELKEQAVSLPVQQEVESVVAERVEPQFWAEKPQEKAVMLQETQDILTREDAFAQLLRIAHFFRRTEPHSPLSYSIETMVRRGRLPLPDLLAELVPDMEARNRFLAIAGIQFDQSDQKST